jgi:cytochrome c oxidase subunit 4
MSHSHEHAHAHDHSKDAKIYTAVLVALLILTVITVSASKIQFGSGMVNVVVALAIATVKATLVSLFFMHLLHDKPVNAIILVTSFMFLGIFLGSCYTDITTRESNIPSGLKSLKPIPVPTTGVGVIDPNAPPAPPVGEQPAGKAPVEAPAAGAHH